MSDLIERQALIAELKREAACGDRDYEKGLLIAADIADLFPSAQPERRGKWVYYKFDTSKEHRWRKCTQCGTAHLMGEEIPGRLTLMWRDFKFCPSCGAKMEAEE